MALDLPLTDEHHSGVVVEYLQTLLNRNGYPVPVTGIFTTETKSAVMAFQRAQQITDDGVVGNLETWPALQRIGPDVSPVVTDLPVVDYRLQPGEYYTQSFPKKTLVLHHTAGSHRPDYSIQGWARDRNRYGGLIPVATAFLVGGKALNGQDGNQFDGRIYRAFPERLWAHHLGLALSRNDLLNAQSIGIELCNYGPLTYRNGQFLTYVGTTVPKTEVIELAVPYKGYRFYQRYTAAQLEATRLLILRLSEAFAIPAKRNYTENWFEVNKDALQGAPGLWTHTSYLHEKFDCYPQPDLLAMLNAL
ncbi:MAG: peptidoglycan-binding protein [Bacteroidetes bacterium]|nr:peptidoglycan-binding protein [Bacteroidota bacterium]